MGVLSSAHLLSVLVLIALISSIISNPNCTLARTCSECISVDSVCTWCTDPGLKLAQRCKSNQAGCKSIVEAPREEHAITANGPFRNDIKETIQLRPQYFIVPLRIGEEVELNIGYKQATNYLNHIGQNVSTSVELVVGNKTDNVQLQIWSNCLGNGFEQTSVCELKDNKTEVSFQIRLKLLYCSTPGRYSADWIEVGLLNTNDIIGIVLKENCQCLCEDEPQRNALECSNNGTLSCGMCTACNGVRTGDKCECDPSFPIDPYNPPAQCLKDGDSKLCSGNGQCVCSRCTCDAFWAGKHCDRDESACYNNGVKCNSQGECMNNQCRCNDQFGGKWCDCPMLKDACISDKKTVQICSDRGDCECGQCKCKQATAHGQFCEHNMVVAESNA